MGVGAGLGAELATEVWMLRRASANAKPRLMSLPPPLAAWADQGTPQPLHAAQLRRTCTHVLRH